MKKVILIGIIGISLFLNLISSSFGEEKETSYTPFFSFKKSDVHREYRLLPFFGYESDTEKDKTQLDILWPISKYSREKDTVNLRVLPFLFYKNDMNRTWMKRKYLYALPLYISSEKDNQKSQVFFPFYGKFEGWFGRDSLDIYMFPLYTKSVKDDETSYNYLWPIVQKGKGAGKESFRVWPLYGMDKVEGKHDKVFYMWPFFNRQKFYGDDGQLSKDRLLFLPFYGYLKSKDRQIDMFMFPIYMGEKRPGQDYIRRDIVWPIVSYTRSEKRNVTQAFPLFRIDKKDDSTRNFFLWPIVWANDLQLANTHEKMCMVLPIYYDKKTETKKKNKETPETPEIINERITKVWPLGSYRRDNDKALFRTLDLLPFDEKGLFGEAFYKNIGAIFSLCEYEKGKTDGSLRFSILKGLFGYERDLGNKTYKLFYFPVYKKKIEASQ
ncbi:MAG: hypothetical protein HZA77_00605 [Candidatus Schekmanbacteria bacterium]|nr:hypothetical protein [Candidatus Schekmanbacteria bacterium]